MGDLSWWHWLLIIAAFILIFGARKLPDAARGIGRSLRILKSEVAAMHEDGDNPAADNPAVGRAAADGATAAPPAAAAGTPLAAPVTPRAATPFVTPAAAASPSASPAPVTAHPAAPVPQPGAQPVAPQYAQPMVSGVPDIEAPPRVPASDGSAGIGDPPQP